MGHARSRRSRSLICKKYWKPTMAARGPSRSFANLSNSFPHSMRPTRRSWRWRERGCAMHTKKLWKSRLKSNGHASRRLRGEDHFVRCPSMSKASRRLLRSTHRSGRPLKYPLLRTQVSKCYCFETFTVSKFPQFQSVRGSNGYV